eukprot:CAMPEP_0174849576 /NCGR_PEP_ID=MMETSP1114-20130205/16644_1 /TAXON_ID=312471 /ORGANISM="Neobodo designis, Strain CCAP 1951/1" /LENGTH=249 /DNA_ID=CAMNT_0016083947 /DNA_START=32 /DNA_END=778 /DNA_ORIENTATION=+
MGCAGSKDNTASNSDFAKGAKFEKDVEFKSANDKFKIVLQADGNLVLYEGESAKWASGTDGKEVTGAAVADDGDLVILNGEEKVWSAGVEGAEKWQLTDDGTLVAVDAEGVQKWTSDPSAYSLRTRSAVVAQKAPVGVEVEEGKTYYWCVCGKSKNQPWCDGSHAGTEFKPMAWTAPETKEVYLCACKQTKNAPFCDGTHASLPEEEKKEEEAAAAADEPAASEEKPAEEAPAAEEKPAAEEAPAAEEK